MTDALDSLELRSLISASGELRLNLEPVRLPPPGPGEVIVRVEAAPINPSDMWLLCGPADLATMGAAILQGRPQLTMSVPKGLLPLVAGRFDQSLPVGNEGAGTVIAAGSEASALLGKKVAMLGGAMYATLRKIPASDCIVLPEKASAADGAAMFVNPLTALGFVETMKAEGHTAIVHAAAASNLGQMLQKICLADGIPLINIVRSEAQAALLKGIGATHVVDSTAADFLARLTDAIAATGATLAFDPIGGGKLAGQILVAMETTLLQSHTGPYNRYGSGVRKQVYIYGALDNGPTILEQRPGFAWRLDAWLVLDFLRTADPLLVQRMRNRVRDELTTTFASHYTRTISLADALRPDIVHCYQRKSTGQKFLIDPSL